MELKRLAEIRKSATVDCFEHHTKAGRHSRTTASASSILGQIGARPCFSAKGRRYFAIGNDGHAFTFIGSIQHPLVRQDQVSAVLGEDCRAILALSRRGLGDGSSSGSRGCVLESRWLLSDGEDRSKKEKVASWALQTTKISYAVPVVRLSWPYSIDVLDQLLAAPPRVTYNPARPAPCRGRRGCRAHRSAGKGPRRGRAARASAPGPRRSWCGNARCPARGRRGAGSRA